MKRAASLYLLISALATQVFGQALKIGDPAPRLDAMEWIKGKPVPVFAPGRVYVVEFWATWCVPCKENIPHLTELAKKYSDSLTVIGVDVREREMSVGTVAQVKAFVSKMGGQMDYTVAMDDPSKNVIYDAWMEAAGMRGIPTAFVVDRAGRISWVGHPAVGNSALEDAVVAAVKGTTDFAAMAAKQSETYTREAARRAYDLAAARTGDALKRRDYFGLLATGQESAQREDPSLRELGSQQVFLASIFLRPEQAEAQLDQVFEAKNKERIDLLQIISAHVPALPRAFVDLVLSHLNRLPESDAMVKHDMLARLYFGIGDSAKAVEEQDKLIEFVKKMPRAHPGWIDALVSTRGKYRGEAGASVP